MGFEQQADLDDFFRVGTARDRGEVRRVLRRPGADKGAAADMTPDKPGCFQNGHGLADGSAADAKTCRKIAFRRQAGAVGKFAGFDPDTQLVGCDGVIINGVATAMGFAYTGVDFDCTSQIDVRGPKGVKGVKPYFEKVDLKIVVYSDESDERFEKLKFNVENRCPVMNLMKDAGVELNADWQKQPAEK